MSDTPFDVHICYRRGDREIAASLARRLEARGVSTQYDAGVGGGGATAAGAGPKMASVFVVLVSSEPHDGQQLRRELAAADHLSRPVVTLLLEDIEPGGATLQMLADRIWIRAHPDPMAQIEEIAELVAQLAGKGTPLPAPPPEPESLEEKASSLDAAISQMLEDTVDPKMRAPTDAKAYVGRANSGGTPAPKRGGAGAAMASILTLGFYGAMARRRAIRSFRANTKRL